MFWHKLFEHKKRNHSGRRQQSGFTFLEIVISLLVLTVGAFSMLQCVNVAMDVNNRATREIITSNLAHALMAEILAKKFAETPTDTNIGSDGEIRFDPPSGTNAFDDVDDYDSGGVIFDGPPPVTISNQVMNGLADAPNYPGFTRSVRVRFVLADGDTPAPLGTFTNLKKITVTVSGPGVNNFEIFRLKSS
jgi:type II secretory pathway pseudopilin PulG